MSTILKALRRLEDQKSQDAAQRPLRDEVVLPPTRSTARTSLVRAALAGIVLAISGAALLWALRPASEPVAVTAPEPLPPVAAAPPAAATGSEPTRITVAAPAPGSAAQVVVPPAPPDFEIVRPDPNAQARPIAPRSLPTIAQDEVLATEPSPTAPRILPVPAPAPADEYVDEPLEEAPEPRMAARGPAVRVAKTLWHPAADRRLAWIEVSGQTALREVREGERVGPYLVLEIEPTAVLLSNGGVEIRREVGP
jgi:hypothetical protein